MSPTEAERHARDCMVEVAPGRRLRCVSVGPSVNERSLAVLEAGSFGFSADWAAVQAALAKEGVRSLAYDRAGLGRSDPGPAPRDSQAICRDLEALLEAIGETGPLILCGHSMAGLHVRLFARRNVARVKGIVLVDAATPEAMDHAVAPHLVAQFTRLARLAALASSTGLPRAFASAFGDAIGLPEPARSEKIQTFADPAHTRWAAAEVGCWRTDAEQARSAGPLDADLPVAVVLTGSPDGALRRHAIQTAPAHDSSAGFVLHAPGADHASLLGERYAHVIVRALLAVEAASKA